MEFSVIQLAYLGPGGPEFLLIMLVLLLLFGAKEAPRILRTLNEFINHIRTTADGFKREVMYGDLKAEPPAYDTEEDEEAYDDIYDDDEDLKHDEDFDYGEEEAAEKHDGNLEQQPGAETPEDEKDDARKD